MPENLSLCKDPEQVYVQKSKNKRGRENNKVDLPGKTRVKTRVGGSSTNPVTKYVVLEPVYEGKRREE